MSTVYGPPVLVILNDSVCPTSTLIAVANP